MNRDVRFGLDDGLRDIHEMCQKTVDMLRLAWDGFRRQDAAPFVMANKLGREIHHQEAALTASMARSRPAAGEGDLLFVPMHLERIGNNIDALTGAVTAMLQDGVPFTDRAMREVGTLMERAVELMECVRDGVATENRVLIRYLLEHGRQFAELVNDYGLAHQQRLIEGVCMPKASSLYLAMLDALKGVESHSRQIAQKLGGRM